MYRKRFNLSGHPLPKNVQGKIFHDKSNGFQLLEKRFRSLLDDPGLGVLTADAGVGKTAAMRHLCSLLPQPEYQVLYLCDTAVSPLDLYRALALELGVKASHRRSQLWIDLKRSIVHLVDERGTTLVVVVDEAQHLSDRFLIDLSGFLNFAFDSRDPLVLWLVGLPALASRLHLQIHAPLQMRVCAQVRLEPLSRDAFLALLEHGLKAAGATTKIVSEPAQELLFRSSRGIPRLASRLLRASLRLAHERDQNFVDEHVVGAANDELSQGAP